MGAGLSNYFILKLHILDNIKHIARNAMERGSGACSGSRSEKSLKIGPNERY